MYAERELSIDAIAPILEILRPTLGIPQRQSFLFPHRSRENGSIALA